MKHIKLLGIVLLLTLGLTACQAAETIVPKSGALTETTTEQTTSEETANATTESTTEPAPFFVEDFALTRLDGTATSLYEYEGQDQIIFLNFWATWCKYCVQEMPLLDELDKRDDVTVLAVSVGEDADLVKSYIDENGYAFNIYLDQEAELASKFGVTGFPTTLFIGPDFEFYGSYPGMIEESMLQSILEQIDAILVERGHK